MIVIAIEFVNCIDKSTQLCYTLYKCIKGVVLLSLSKNRKFTRLPDAEFDVIQIIWEKNRPLRNAEIYEELRKRRKCSKQSTHTLLSRLEKRGYIKTETVDCPVSYKIVYPLINEEEYLANESESFFNKIFRANNV